MRPEFLKKKFNSLLLFLYDHCWKSSAAADNGENLYNVLIKNADFLTETKKFSIIDDRVDAFYARIFDSSNTFDLVDWCNWLIVRFPHMEMLEWNLDLPNIANHCYPKNCV